MLLDFSGIPKKSSNINYTLSFLGILKILVL